MKHKYLTSVLLAVSILVTGCSSTSEGDSKINSNNSSSVIPNGTSSETENNGEVITAFSKIDNTKWQYNESNDVYWQIGIS